MTFIYSINRYACIAPDAHDVEDFLSSLMDQEFDTIIEDGSLTEVISSVNVVLSVLRGSHVPLCEYRSIFFLERLFINMSYKVVFPAHAVKKHVLC